MLDIYKKDLKGRKAIEESILAAFNLKAGTRRVSVRRSSTLGAGSLRPRGWATNDTCPHAADLGGLLCACVCENSLLELSCCRLLALHASVNIITLALLCSA